MKFLVPNYSCLQNPWLGGYCPQIPVLSVLNWICWNPPPPEKKFLGTPLAVYTMCHCHWLLYLDWLYLYILLYHKQNGDESRIVWILSLQTSEEGIYKTQIPVHCSSIEVVYSWRSVILDNIKCKAIEQLMTHWNVWVSTDGDHVYLWSWISVVMTASCVPNIPPLCLYEIWGYHNILRP